MIQQSDINELFIKEGFRLNKDRCDDLEKPSYRTYKNKHGYHAFIQFDAQTQMPLKILVSQSKTTHRFVPIDESLPIEAKGNYETAYFLHCDNHILRFTYVGDIQHIQYDQRDKNTEVFSYSYTNSGGKLIKYQDSLGNYWDSSMGCHNLFGDPMDLVLNIMGLFRVSLTERLDVEETRYVPRNHPHYATARGE